MVVRSEMSLSGDRARTVDDDVNDEIVQVNDLSLMIRCLLADYSGGECTPVDQMIYIIGLFLHTLPPHTNGFPKKMIGDTESNGLLKRPYHPLSTEVDGVVRFSPYMIVEIAKERQR